MSRLLVVVDMQKDFVDGALGSPEAQAIVPHVLDKIKAYQDAGDEVVFTLDTHFDDYGREKASGGPLRQGNAGLGTDTGAQGNFRDPF